MVGLILCRAEKSSILAVVAGLPSGEAEIDFCPINKGNTGIDKGSRTAPTKCSRPFGRRALR